MTLNEAQENVRTWRDCLSSRLADPECDEGLLEAAENELWNARETLSGLLKERDS